MNNREWLLGGFSGTMIKNIQAHGWYSPVQVILQRVEDSPKRTANEQMKGTRLASTGTAAEVHGGVSGTYYYYYECTEGSPASTIQNQLESRRRRLAGGRLPQYYEQECRRGSPRDQGPAVRYD
jgi:hypothetical protein